MFILFLLLTSFVHARDLSTYIVPGGDFDLLKTISTFYSIESKQGQNWEVTVPQDDAAFFLSIAPQAQLKEWDSSAALRKQLDQYRSESLLSEFRYHNFTEVQSWMDGLQQKYPNLVTLISYGKSYENRPLVALSVAENQSLPALMLTFATHGDELITTELCIHLVDQLLENFGKDPRLTQMIQSHRLIFIPVVNADGFAMQNRYDGIRDPNRSYPFPDLPNNSPTASIRALISLFESQNIVGTIDFHAFGEMIMYPWAYTHDSIERKDAESFHQLSGSMAQNNHYAYGPISDVIYIAAGSSADYYYWKKKTTSLAVEIGSSKAPSPSQFPTYFEALREPTWRFIEWFR